jgi:hypothetical protein
MKKIAIVALIATLTSCGGSETKAPATTDSTAVKTDSTKVDSTKTKTADTTKVVAPAKVK